MTVVARMTERPQLSPKWRARLSGTLSVWPAIWNWRSGISLSTSETSARVASPSSRSWAEPEPKSTPEGSSTTMRLLTMRTRSRPLSIMARKRSIRLRKVSRRARAWRSPLPELFEGALGLFEAGLEAAALAFEDLHVPFELLYILAQRAQTSDHLLVGAQDLRELAFEALSLRLRALELLGQIVSAGVRGVEILLGRSHRPSRRRRRSG